MCILFIDDGMELNWTFFTFININTILFYYTNYDNNIDVYLSPK